MKKKLLLSLAIGLTMFNYGLLAQQDAPDYQTTMKGLMIKMDTASDVPMNLKVASDFDRVGEVAQTQWHPFYYAALCNVLAAFDIEDVAKVDPLCDKALGLLDKAEKLSPKNSEIYCIKAMISLAKIKVNVFQRGMEGLSDAQASLESAQELNPDNPRVYFLLGQQSYNTPEAFGGSRKNALALFEKAQILFEKEGNKKDSFEASWGLETTLKKIESCKKYLQTKIAANK
jgi:tetratricopeptide (TPR) repeat protein